MSTLKPCPFCGKDEANFTTDKWGYYYVECEYCGAQTNPYDDKEFVIEEWQTRPIEDDLRNRIAELEAELDKDVDLTIVGLRKELSVAQAKIDEQKAFIQHQHLWQEGEDAKERAYLERLVPVLKNRIAELEGKFDQLTAHDATERQDDKSPNDTQTQTIVCGKESEK